MIHLYWGEGKGKTTAAMGLALRALGHGRRVSVVQFLKDGAAVYTCAEEKFTWQMDREERRLARERFTELLSAALREPADLLVLDEACAACEAGLLDEEVLRAAVLRAAKQAEVVLTGRVPMDWMLKSADYITEMRACRHPYERGIAAREGIEY